MSFTVAQTAVSKHHVYRFIFNISWFWFVDYQSKKKADFCCNHPILYLSPILLQKMIAFICVCNFITVYVLAWCAHTAWALLFPQRTCTPCPVRQKAALPGAAVREHHPSTRAVALQRVSRTRTEMCWVETRVRGGEFVSEWKGRFCKVTHFTGNCFLR